MKKLIFPVLIAFLAACSGGDKKAELAEKKKKLAELSTEIAKLEREIEKEGGSKDAGNAKMVEVAELHKDLFEHYFQVQGKVDAEENVYCWPETMGRVEKILVQPGQQVSVGQTLATLDSKAMQETVSEIQVQLDFATSMFAKQKNLWDQKIGSEMQYLQAKTSKESLEKRLASVKEQLHMSRITSPINGTVDAVDVKIGQAVSPGIPGGGIRVVNFSKLKVKAEIGESYAGMFKQGSKVNILFTDIKDSSTAKLSYVGKVIDPVNRTFTAEARLIGNRNYSPNMIAVMKINDYISATPVISVPVNTVQRSETGEQYVYIVENKKAVRKPVKVGKVYNGQAEILEGLEEGSKIVVKGYSDLNEGEAVKF